MNWQDVSGKSAASVAHWQKISQFRARHPAIGAGSVVLDSVPDNALVVGEKARVKVIK